MFNLVRKPEDRLSHETAHLDKADLHSEKIMKLLLFPFCLSRGEKCFAMLLTIKLHYSIKAVSPQQDPPRNLRQNKHSSTTVITLSIILRKPASHKENDKDAGQSSRSDQRLCCTKLEKN